MMSPCSSCRAKVSPIPVTKPHLSSRRALTCRHFASQTSVMAQTYLLFDFGSDEAKVQQARHKLESWKQAFRLDKKLQYKLEREQAASPEPAATPALEKTEKPKPGKAKTKPKTNSSDTPAEEENNGPVKLFIRLYFSGHEKLSEQRFLDRIEAEELFQSASPETVKSNDPSFSETESRFEDLA